MSYTIGMYLRLSDDDKDIGDFKVESNSIAHQRTFIKHFISTQSDLLNAKAEEYVEDGHTGVNFKRPSVIRLLEDVKKGIINCIIVKDLSRFGRNAIEVGDYLEKIFPLLNVRFIAINDGYDSHKQENTHQALNIDVAFRNLMNEAYSRDISQKIKAIKKIQKEQGKVICSVAPFGYLVVNHQYVIDEETAPIVKYIFSLAADGVNFNEIAKRLNNDEFATSQKKRWTSSVVSNILHNKVYIGTLINNRYETIAPRIKKSNDKSSWLVFEEHHPAIIDKDLFEKVSKGFRKQTSSKKRHSYYDELKGKVRCGGCGIALSRHYVKASQNSKMNIYFTCDYATLQGCCKEKIYIEPLKKMVLNILTAQIRIVIADFEVLKKNISNEMQITDEAIKKVTADLDLYQKQKALLYTDYKSGIFTVEQYLEKREVLNTKAAKLNRQLAELTQSQEKSDNFNALNDIIETLKDNQLTQEQLIKDYVKEIRVFAPDKIEVEFSFENML